MSQNSTDTTKNAFIKYLDSLGLSAKSHKNYRSDLTHFMGWMFLKVRALGSYIETLGEVVPFLGKHIAMEYKKFMVENNNPQATINRRLSTLRHLSKFLVTSGLMQDDFTRDIENITKVITKTIKPNNLLNEFQVHLETRKVSKSTIKNYVSDIRQFLSWLENVETQKITN